MKLEKPKIIRLSVISALLIIIIIEAAYILNNSLLLPRNINAPEDTDITTQIITKKNNEDTFSPPPVYEPEDKKIIVLDPGHGKSSAQMSDEERAEYGWVKNSDGKWGEWRHYKSGSSTQDCGGSGCNLKGDCWYSIDRSNRDSEPEINLNNALAAKKYLEEMNYTVRITRSSCDENPSITRRVSYCYPNNDTSVTADAAILVVIHSNAGGGSGTAYIAPDSGYDQRGINESYVADSKRLGESINKSIVATTSLTVSGSGVINKPELIAFCKSPVPCGYMEIGFYDNSRDLEILKNESDKIGKAIAVGIDNYFKE